MAFWEALAPSEVLPASQAQEPAGLQDAISSTVLPVSCVAAPRAVCRRMFLIA